MTALSIFLGLLLLLFCVVFTHMRSKKSGRLVLLDLSILAVGLIYGLGWVLVIGFTEAGHNDLWALSLLPYEHYYVVGNALAFVLAFCIVIGWSIASRISVRARRFSLGHLSFDAEIVHVYAWFIFLISFVLRWLYVRDFGGFIAYLDHAAAIRSAILNFHNRFSFLQPFGMMAIFSSFMFFGSIVSGKRSVAKILGLFLSVPFSIYVLYSLLGRIDFLIYLATFVLAFLYIRQVKPSRLLLGAIIGGPAIVVCAYVLSNLLEMRGADSLPQYVSKELSFPFASFFAQLNDGRYLFRWYQDFLLAPLYVLPSSWWVQWVEEASQINTMIVLGAKKGDFGVTSGIPVDLVTLGLMQSSFFGVAVVGVLFGAMIRTLQGFTDGIADSGLRAVLWSFLAIRVATVAIAYAHPLHLIMGVFGVAFSVAVVCLLSLSSRVRIRGNG